MKNLILLLSISFSSVAFAQSNNSSYEEWLNRMGYEGNSEIEKISSLLDQDQLQTSHDLKFLSCEHQIELNKRIEAYANGSKSKDELEKLKQKYAKSKDEYQSAIEDYKKTHRDKSKNSKDAKRVFLNAQEKNKDHSRAKYKLEGEERRYLFAEKAKAYLKAQGQNCVDYNPAEFDEDLRSYNEEGTF